MRQMAGTIVGFPDAAADGGRQVARLPCPGSCRPGFGPWSRCGSTPARPCQRSRACQQPAGDRIVMASAAKGALVAPGAADSVLRNRLRALDGGAGGAAPLSPRPVVNPDPLPPEQAGEHEPGGGRASPDSAVGDQLTPTVEDGR